MNITLLSVFYYMHSKCWYIQTLQTTRTRTRSHSILIENSHSHVLTHNTQHNSSIILSPRLASYVLQLLQQIMCPRWGKHFNMLAGSPTAKKKEIENAVENSITA